MCATQPTRTCNQQRRLLSLLQIERVLTCLASLSCSPFDADTADGGRAAAPQGSALLRAVCSRAKALAGILSVLVNTIFAMPTILDALVSSRAATSLPSCSDMLMIMTRFSYLGIGVCHECCIGSAHLPAINLAASEPYHWCCSSSLFLV